MKSLAVLATLFAVTPIAAAEAVRSDFWRDRETAYRTNLRGPFTAIRAECLSPGSAVTLYASDRGVSAEPGGPAR